MEINLDLIEILRWVNLTLVIVAMGAWIYFYRRFREPAALTALLWLINAFLYFSYRLFLLTFDSSIKNTYALNAWSSFLHTHAIILLAVGAFVAMNRLIHNKTYMDRLEEKLKKELEEKEDKNE
jgi:hypothetical protein